jgi:hypothetical protein
MTSAILQNAKVVRGRSALELKFLLLWRAMNGPKLQEEVVFAPPRKWRSDFAFERPSNVSVSSYHRLRFGLRVAIEIEGAIWSGSRHTRGAGFAVDCEKYNTAALAGAAGYF